MKIKLEELIIASDADIAGPVSVHKINRYEKQLNLKFGPAYKKYISKFGCVASGANEIYGLCGDNKSIPSAIHSTRSARRDPQFPRNLWVIADDGSGRKYCADSEDQIYFCDQNSCSQLDKTFEDFAVEWLGACK